MRAVTLATTVLLAAAPPAVAAETYVLFTNANQINLVDPASVQVVSANVRRVRMVAVRRIMPKTHAPGFMAADWEFDCRLRRSRVLNLTLYDAHGAVQQALSKPSSWQGEDRADSAGAAARAYACNRPPPVAGATVPVGLVEAAVLVLDGPWPVVQSR